MQKNSLDLDGNDYFHIKPIKIPVFLVPWMFIIFKENSIIYSNSIIYTVKTKVCNTVLILKNIKQNKNSKIKYK